MKKFYFYLSFVLVALSSLMMVSCDDDVDRAITLSGSWRGDFGMYYIYEHRGKEIQYNSYDTDIVFYPDYDYATHGYGKQVDWYERGPYEKMYYKFDWRIRDGVIYLTYPHNPELNTAIYDYTMSHNTFTGYFDNANDRFRLYKIADYYDWDYYHDDYYYYDRYDWYDDYFYSSRAASVEEDNEPGAIIKQGNRFSEK